jgi:hypothetical protein
MEEFALEAVVVVVAAKDSKGERGGSGGGGREDDSDGDDIYSCEANWYDTGMICLICVISLSGNSPRGCRNCTA